MWNETLSRAGDNTSKARERKGDDGVATCCELIKWDHAEGERTDITACMILHIWARFKRRIVSTEMQNNNWFNSISGINTQELIQEYILLFLALSTVQLTDHPDEIKWNWTMSGKYTVA
jgi:hypothetical protein